MDPQSQSDNLMIMWLLGFAVGILLFYALFYPEYEEDEDDIL